MFPKLTKCLNRTFRTGELCCENILNEAKDIRNKMFCLNGIDAEKRQLIIENKQTNKEAFINQIHE